VAQIRQQNKHEPPERQRVSLGGVALVSSLQANYNSNALPLAVHLLKQRDPTMNSSRLSSLRVILIAHVLCCSVIMADEGKTKSSNATEPEERLNVAKMQFFEGFFKFYWDDSRGKVWLEIRQFDSPFLYVNSLARRLVEAGVTFVTVVDPGIGLSSSGWDLHRQVEPGMNKACPRMGCVVTALIEDLHERGLDKKVLLVVWGEFGRTPRINKDAGRDHWGDLQSVLVSGGGFRCGQVIGSSNSKGEIPKDRRLWPYDMLATMYHHLGIDVHREFHNLAGRAIPILARGTPIRELL
jgi:hypothetical protein